MIFMHAIMIATVWRWVESSGSIPTSLKIRMNPVIAADASGGFIITWKSTSTLDGSGAGIFAQRFAANDAPVGGEFQVNTTGSGNQDKPTIAMAGDGHFVIAWKSGNDQDGDKGGIYAQIFSATGTKTGGEFRVNTTTAEDQDVPSISMDGNGAFTIAWTSKDQDGSGKGVYAQRFNSNGALIGGEFGVNTTTANNQDQPAIAVNSLGNMIVAWQGKGPGDNAGIFNLLYPAANDAPANTVPGPQTVNEDIGLVFSTANGNAIRHRRCGCAGQHRTRNAYGGKRGPYARDVEWADICYRRWQRRCDDDF